MSPSEINGRAPSIDLARPAISPRNLLRSGTPTAHERVALPLLPSGPGGVRRFSLRGAQPSTPPREAHSTRRSLERGFNPPVADCGLQGTATSRSTAAPPYIPNPREAAIRTPPGALLPPYPISSRTPSTGRAPPSASTLVALRFKELRDEPPAFLAQHA